MEIFYCDTCGKRAVEADKEASLRLGQDKIFCPGCRVKAMPAAAVQTKTEPRLRAQHAGGSGNLKAPRGESSARSAAGAKVEGAPRKTYTLPAAIGATVLILGVLIVTLAGGGKASSKPTDSKQASKTA